MKQYSQIISIILITLLSATIVTAVEVTVSDYDPKPAEAGKYLNVWLKVENPSEDPLTDAFLEIIPKDGLIVSPGEESEKRVGYLQGKSSQTVMFRLKVLDDAVEGPNIITTHFIQGKSIRKQDLEIEVTEKDLLDVNLEIGDVESSPTRIKPNDDDVKLTVTLQNLGDGNAQGVKAELIELPDGITLSESYSGTELIGNIDADDTGVAVFYIDVEETVLPGELEAKVELSYKYKSDANEDDYVYETKKIPLKLPIRSVPLYEITTVEIMPGELTAGDKNVKLRLTVKNVGHEDGEAVRLKVYGKTEQPFTWEESSDFISPLLEPGSEGQATLEFKVDKDANVQTYYLDLEIKNLVGDDVLTYQKTIPIDVTYPRPDNPWSITKIGLILMLGFIVFVVIGKIRKEKKTGKKK